MTKWYNRASFLQKKEYTGLKHCIIARIYWEVTNIYRKRQPRDAVKNPRLSSQQVEPFGSASFTESTALSSACSIIIRLRAWCLVSSAKETLAGVRVCPSINRDFCSRSRHAKKITTGICLISESRKLAYLRGLFFSRNAEIGQVNEPARLRKDHL